MFRQNIKLAFRNIIRQRGYSIINLAGLTVGLAFSLLVLLWVRYEYSVDRHHENLDQIYLVAFSCDNDNYHGEYTVGALGPYLRFTYPEITHATRYSSTPTIPFEYEGEQYISNGQFVDPDFLKIFTFDFLESNPENAFESPLSVVITGSLANRIFGNGEAVGKALKVNEQLSLTVGAVVEDPPASSRLQFDFLLSCAINPSGFSKWDVKSLQNFVMLAPGADFNQVSDKIRDVYNDHNEGTYPNYQYLFPMRDLYLYGLNGDGRIQYVQIFSILAIIVLLIACVNFMNLSTARAATRYREIGIKKTLGAGRRQMAWQFLIEAGIITFTATLVAIVLVEFLIPGLNAIAKTQVSFDFSWATLGLVFAVMLGTGLLAWSYPAFYLSSFRPISVLCGVFSPFETQKSGRGKRFRQILVTLQFAISIALVLGVMGIFGQLGYIRDMDIGFNKDHVAIFNLPRQAMAHTSTIKEKLLRNPDIENVTVSANSLIRWQTSMGIGWEGKDPANVFDVGRNWVDYDYAKTFQIDMVEGRFFSSEFPTDLNDAIVINEACVKSMGISDPIGRKITIAPGSSIEEKGTIVGVIRDHHTESAHTEIRPFLLSCTERGSRMCARINPKNIGGSISFLRETINEVVPDTRINFRFYDDMTYALYKDEVMTGIVVIYVTVIAIFISCLGLYGLAAFMAMQRAKEISIRRVLGASISSVISLMSREFLILVLVAGVIASPFAWYFLNHWLEGFAFRMTMGPGMYFSAVIIACVISLITVMSQAYRAAIRNPAETLRQE